MTTVAVAGASGKLGRHVVRDLHEHGYRVVALDRMPDASSPADASVRVELTDHGQVLEAFTGVDDRYHAVDAVVHLAAIPAPGLTTNAVTFANNITATYNVFAAARTAGIRNIVWASSETVLGLPFDTPPPYIPVDEEYPPRPESTYSMTEEMLGEREMPEGEADTRAELLLDAFDFSERSPRVRAFVVAVLEDDTADCRTADVIDFLVKRLAARTSRPKLRNLPPPSSFRPPAS